MHFSQTSSSDTQIDILGLAMEVSRMVGAEKNT